MTGYVPLFDSLTRGTLCGRWPDIGLWPIVLSLSDKHGIVDVTPTYIAGVTGLSIEDVAACMKRFCEPDPYSRSSDEDGRRLSLLDPSHREWGWRIVNHGMYREKARLMAKAAREVETGQNKSRMDRRSPPLTAAHRPVPPDTASDPLSNANADSNEEKNSPRKKTSSESARARRSRRCPENFSPDLAYAEAQIPDIDAAAESQKLKDYEFATPRSDWAAVWRLWIGRCKESGRYARRSPGGKPQLVDKLTGQVMVFE